MPDTLATVRILRYCNSASGLRVIHGVLTVAWLASSVPILLFFRDSIPIILFISIYANVVGHWSAWQASRVEVIQESESD